MIDTSHYITIKDSKGETISTGNSTTKHNAISDAIRNIATRFHSGDIAGALQRVHTLELEVVTRRPGVDL